MAISRRTLFRKLNPLLSETLERGTEFCRLKGHSEVELVHWLHILLLQPDSDLQCILRFFAVDQAQLEADILRTLSRLPGGATTVNDFSPLIDLSIENAWMIASLEEEPFPQIHSGHLLITWLTQPGLCRALLTVSRVFALLSADEIRQHFTEITRHSPERQYAVAPELLPEYREISHQNSSRNKALATYTSDLTALARQGKIDPVCGRDQEITRLIDVLLRRKQNNPLLVGDAGVGKTAVVEGLALAIVAGEVPPQLREAQLLVVDLVALTAGSGTRGEFEGRLKGVLDAAVESVWPVILFIDEVHSLIGAGGTAGTGDAANLMKPMLARGDLRAIGATTHSEFKRYIEKDPAFSRRFQVIRVEEPSEELAILMLRGILPVLEQHHHVLITDQAVQAAVRLSHRYLPERQLPDKAISLLDTACARTAVAEYTPPEALQRLRFQARSATRELELTEPPRRLAGNVTVDPLRLREQIACYNTEADIIEHRWQQQCRRLSEIRQLRLQWQSAEGEQRQTLEQALLSLQNDLREPQDPPLMVRAEVNDAAVADIVAQWTGIPVGRVLKDDLQAVRELPERLKRRVLGQDHAIRLLSKNISIARAGLADPQKPCGVFLLTGPSGIGKTETALALAGELFGGDQHLVTINMSEYQEAHSISGLKGSPPGYIGYGEGGVLTEAVRRRPYSVVLLDEIEKAHPDIYELFFQVFDKGRMEDGEGRQIDFRNTLILLTSNLGSDLLTKTTEEPESALLTEQLHAELLTYFPAAFLGRISVIPYLPLSSGIIKEIVRSQMDKVSARFTQQHNMSLEYSESLLNYIITLNRTTSSGARGIIHVIERKVLPVIAGYILQPSGPEVLAVDGVIVSYSESHGVTVTSGGEPHQRELTDLNKQP